MTDLITYARSHARTSALGFLAGAAFGYFAGEAANSHFESLKDAPQVLKYFVDLAGMYSGGRMISDIAAIPFGVKYYKFLR